MTTIERRVAELERTGPCAAQPMVVFLDETEAEAVDSAAVQEAKRTGRLVIKVRFVQPDTSTNEQQS